MIKLPSSVKIDNIEYEVKIIKNLKDEGNELMGCVTYHESVIKIDASQSQDQAINTLAHECMHAISFERGIDSLLKESILERVIDEMAKGFVQLIRDNPELIKCIKKTK